jgi:hypothetical protein
LVRRGRRPAALGRPVSPKSPLRSSERDGEEGISVRGRRRSVAGGAGRSVEPLGAPPIESNRPTDQKAKGGRRDGAAGGAAADKGSRPANKKKASPLSLSLARR